MAHYCTPRSLTGPPTTPLLSSCSSTENSVCFVQPLKPAGKEKKKEEAKEAWRVKAGRQSHDPNGHHEKNTVQCSGPRQRPGASACGVRNQSPRGSERSQHLILERGQFLTDGWAKSEQDMRRTRRRMSRRMKSGRTTMRGMTAKMMTRHQAQHGRSGASTDAHWWAGQGAHIAWWSRGRAGQVWGHRCCRADGLAGDF